MSYILDALRRADAERERGGVPGLHTQAMPDLGDDERMPRARGLQPWHWVVIGLTGGLAVAVAWQWSGSEPAPPAASLPPPPIAVAAPPADPPAAVPAPAPTPVPVATAPTAPPSVAPAIAPMRATPAPASVTPSANAASVAAAPAPLRVASLAELPTDVRAGLPTLAFGGSIYSNTPANRLLIVNGQLLHEGDALGPGATLEQIKPKAAVINVRGQRFEIGL
jgi:general secretion pathway protein B